MGMRQVQILEATKTTKNSVGRRSISVFQTALLISLRKRMLLLVRKVMKNLFPFKDIII